MNDLFDKVNEIWLPIPEFEEYLVSNLGRVFSKKANRVLRPIKTRGYLRVALCKSDGVYFKYVHRLVLGAFCPPLDNKLEVNHVNGIKEDNRLANLAWITRRENMQHSAHRLKNAHGPKPKPVGQFTRDGQLIAEYRSASEASRATGVDRSSICQCANNRPKCSQAGGYIWRYIEDANLSKAA